ncbi:GNAT family N-acetyltransferase [Deinococcus pimensis]|uniref:GNAT family N-acetyltransferase n=1 Tax=Deinococcus pimensis TaxID=309888 RepID=UPI00047F15DB|nr:GNAT family N-acetyltransferase [Deinococcus pimensis]
MTAVVRPTTLDDAGVFHDVMMAAGRHDLDPRASWHRVTLTDVAVSLGQYGGFVAEEDGRILGVVSHRPWGRTLTLNKLAVLPEARGRGLATLLVRAVEAHAARHGYEQVLLAVSSYNTRLVPMYEHLGYRVDPEAVYPFANPTSPAPVVLVKAAEVHA